MRFAIVLLLALVAGSPVAAQQSGYVVIVNEANGVSAMSAADLSKVFFKKVNRWSTGLDAVPVDLPEGAAAREAFNATVHGKTLGAVRAYWQQQIFSGRGVPPVEKATDEMVVAFVRATPGAVGYVSASTPLGAGVKRLQVVN